MDHKHSTKNKPIMKPYSKETFKYFYTTSIIIFSRLKVLFFWKLYQFSYWSKSSVPIFL